MAQNASPGMYNLKNFQGSMPPDPPRGEEHPHPKTSSYASVAAFIVAKNF